MPFTLNGCRNVTDLLVVRFVMVRSIPVFGREFAVVGGAQIVAELIGRAQGSE
jgi:hypothetical protein